MQKQQENEIKRQKRQNIDAPVMTSFDKADGPKNEKAKKQINKSFKQIKKFTVGCEKPDLRGYD